MKPQDLKNDESVKIPAAVKAAAARSDELFHAYRDTPAEAPVTSEGNEQSPDGQPPLQATPEPQTEPQTATEAKSEPPEESWEHKYKSVNGRYARAQDQIRELTEQIQNLRGVIATMQATTPQRVAPADLPDPVEPDFTITPEEANDYGEDFLKVVGKKAKAELAPILNAYKAEIASLKKQLDGVSGFVQQDAQSKLLNELDQRLPSWREMNTNKQFLDWLGLPDPYSGAMRHDMLRAAYAQGDARRVLAFFNGFLAEEAAVAPATGQPDQGQKIPKVPLETLAAPGRAKSAASTQAPAEKPVFTRAQIAAFYADSAAGRYRGRDAEREKLERLIFEAQREGRIR